MEKEIDISLVYQSGSQKFYLGAIPDDYHGLGFEVVICCIPEVAKNPSKIEVLQIPFQDSWYPEDQPTTEQLRRWLQTMRILIDGRDVLFHCYQGMNRSALMLALYLWEYHRKEFTGKGNLIGILRSARYPLLQNHHFVKIIEEW